MLRSGGEGESLPGDGDYYALKISPDGLHLLTNQTDPHTGSTGVWSFDLNRKTDTPVTTGGVDFFPIWSPDALKVAFAKSDGTAERGMRLMIVLTTGGEPRVLMDVRGPVFPSDWSSDGSLLAYTGYQPLAEVIVVSIHDSIATKVWSYSPAAHSAGGAVFKPSKLHERPRWIAYTSDESGRDEVYLQSLEPDRAKVQVSVSGGNRPLWRKRRPRTILRRCPRGVVRSGCPGEQREVGDSTAAFQITRISARSSPLHARLRPQLGRTTFPDSPCRSRGRAAGHQSHQINPSELNS